MSISDKPFALLIDIASIQKYIFSSNKLAINIGASYIVERNLFSDAFMPTEYNNTQIAYRGGGNALLLFANEDDRSAYLREYRKKVISAYPGTKVLAGTYDNFLPYEEGYVMSMKALHDSLRACKNLTHTNHHLPLHGLSARCPITGEAQSDKMQYKEAVSNSAYYKLDAAEVSSKDYYNLEYKDILGEWRFTNEINQLGQPAEKSYVAVVHVDGNGIGQEFRKSSSLKYTQELSAEVSRLGSKVLKVVVQEAVTVANKLLAQSEEDASGFNFTQDEDGHYLLPIRPILAGGDDFTFVCEGKLGVYLAEKMLEHIEVYQPATSEFSDGKHPQFNRACAGIAIVPTKFPFFKAYQLAEELCQKAKVASRADDGASHLSFMLFRRNTTKNLSKLVNLQYTNTVSQKVYHQAYRFAPDPQHLRNSKWTQLKTMLLQFHNTESWSSSRIMRLRDALYGSADMREYFTTLYNARKKDGVDFEITSANETLLHDAIELYDFYPKALLEMTDLPTNHASSLKTEANA